MQFDKNDLIATISNIYRAEDYFKNLEQGCIENEKQSNELVKKIILLESEGEVEEELKNEIIETNKSIRNTLSKVRKLKLGKKSLFKWRFMDLGKVHDINISYKNEELKKWLETNVKKDQKVVFSKIDFQYIIGLLNNDSKTDQNKLNKYADFKYEICEMYISSPLYLKGKETSYMYLKFNDDTEKVLKCKSTDIISSVLLNIEDDLDISILNNLKENNDLSLLYSLAYEEASMVNENSDDKDKLIELSKKLDNILNKEE